VAAQRSNAELCSRGTTELHIHFLSLSLSLSLCISASCCCIILMFIRLSFVHFPLLLLLPLPIAAAHLCGNLPSTSCAALCEPFCNFNLYNFYFICTKKFLHSVFRMPTATCENSSEVLCPRISFEKLVFGYIYNIDFSR